MLVGARRQVFAYAYACDRRSLSRTDLRHAVWVSVGGCGCGCCIVDAGIKRYVPYTLNDDSRLTDPWEEKYFECTLVMLPYLGNGHENAG